MIKKPKVILVDDHKIFRQGLSFILNSENIATIIGEASNGIEFLDILSNTEPDLVIMDINMPGMDGMEATQKALALKPSLKIIAYTMFGDEEYYERMTCIGVKGFILKSCGINDLERAIHAVMLGDKYYANAIAR